MIAEVACLEINVPERCAIIFEWRHLACGWRASLLAWFTPSLTVGLLPRVTTRDYREAASQSQIEVSRSANAALYFRRTNAMKKEKISELTTNRLSVYLRCLNELTAAGIKTVSSQELAEQFNLNSAQIRKDLGYFGEFGVRGIGYFVDELRAHLTKILGLDQPHRVGIVGAGRLGTALANYNGLEKSNFTVVALLDNDNEKIRQRIGPDRIPVYDVKKIAKVVRDEKIDVAVIA